MGNELRSLPSMICIDSATDCQPHFAYRRKPTTLQESTPRQTILRKELWRTLQAMSTQVYSSSALHFLRMPPLLRTRTLLNTAPPLRLQLSTTLRARSKHSGPILVWDVVLRCIMALTARSGSVAQLFGCSTPSPAAV